MRRWDTVAIVGVGLIGGSIGLALRQRELARQIVGIGRRPGSLRVARRLGAVDATTVNLARGVADAELVVVCTPVDQIVEHVRTAAEAAPPGALITDAGSTKRAIVEELEANLAQGAPYVGSHPLAGSEKSGPAAARADLLEGRVVVVTPTRSTPREACQAVSDFWASLGGRVLLMSPAEHDRALAATSHLPHLVASALAAATPERYLPLTATGWSDTTRVAAADPELWAQIFAANRANVLASLEAFERALAALRAALERGDDRRLARLLQRAKETRDGKSGE